MEALLSQFSLLADQALEDKNFDPSQLDDLMKLFEVEAYNAWSAAEAEHREAASDAEVAMREAEDELSSLLDEAMEEFRRTEEAMERAAEEELSSLVLAAKAAKRMGHALGAAATVASKKYMDAALASAIATMRSTKNGLSMTKVHPS